MIRRFVKFGVLLSLSLSLYGCEQEVKEDLQTRIDQRAAEGQKVVDGILGERDEMIRSSLASTMGDMKTAVKTIQDIEAAQKALQAEIDAEYAANPDAAKDGVVKATASREAALRRLAADRLQKRFERKPEEEEIDEEEENILKFHLANHPDSSAVHPLVTWRKAFTGNTVESLNGESKKYPGTMLEKNIPDYMTFLQNQSEYWAGSTREMQVGASDYVPFLREYASDNGDSPMFDDAMFDIAFIHAQQSFYSRRKAVRVDEWLTFHTKYFQLLFQVPRVSKEDFESYVERLCRGYALESRVAALHTALTAELQRTPSSFDLLQTMQTAIAVHNTSGQSGKVSATFADGASIAGGGEQVVGPGETIVIRAIGGAAGDEAPTFPRTVTLKAISGDGLELLHFAVNESSTKVTAEGIQAFVYGEDLALTESDLMAAEGLVRSGCSIPGEKSKRIQCLDMPSEFRAIAVASNYYDGVICRLRSIDPEAGNPYKDSLEYLTRQLSAYKPETSGARLVEYPRMPDLFSIDPAKKKLVLEIGSQGVFFGPDQRNWSARPVDAILSSNNAASAVSAEVLLASENGDYTLSGSDASKLRAKVKTSLAAHRTDGGQAYVGVNADATLNASDVMTVATAARDFDMEGWKNLLNREVWLAGRHRVTGKNQKRSLQLRLLPRKGMEAEEGAPTGVDGKKLNILKHVSGLSVKTPAGNKSCSVIGYTGDAVVGEYLPATGAAMLKGDGALTWGAFPPTPETPDGQPDATPSTDMTAGGSATTAEVASLDWRKLSDFVSDRNDAVILGFDSRTSWNVLLKALSAMAYKCTEDGCTKSEPRDGLNVYVALCR